MSRKEVVIKMPLKGEHASRLETLYSIEQGLLGPPVRVTLGALLAIALISAGEWARRTERLVRISGLPKISVAGVSSRSTRK